MTKRQWRPTIPAVSTDARPQSPEQRARSRAQTPAGLERELLHAAHFGPECRSGNGRTALPLEGGSYSFHTFRHAPCLVARSVVAVGREGGDLRSARGDDSGHTSTARRGRTDAQVAARFHPLSAARASLSSRGEQLARPFNPRPLAVYSMMSKRLPVSLHCRVTGRVLPARARPAQTWRSTERAGTAATQFAGVVQ
jgi:hypothetical protein